MDLSKAYEYTSMIMSENLLNRDAKEGIDAFLNKNPENLSRILTNPTDIIGSLNNLLITNLVLIFIIIVVFLYSRMFGV